MKNILIAALFFATPLQVYAETNPDFDFDCGDYYGLNICATDFELADDQTTNIKPGPNQITTKAELGALFRTNLTDNQMDQIEKDSIFENADSFRAYMKTAGSTGTANTDSEFLVTTRILDNPHFGLDCRLVTHTISELTSSNYYDCALQRYF